MDPIKIFLVFFSIFKCLHASIFESVLSSSNPLVPAIFVRLPAGAGTNTSVIDQLATDYKAVRSVLDLGQLLRRFRENNPGYYATLFPLPLNNNSAGKDYRTYLANSFNFNAYETDSIMPRNLEEWKRALVNFQTSFLPVSIRRSYLVADAVQAYKNFDRIPFIIPRHLYNRNIKVTFADEQGEDLGGLSNEFFTIFFREIIEKSNLFTLNSEGYVILTPNKTFTEDLDIYEAFGFYLAKALQNNIPVGCHFAQIIIEMIQFGKLNLNCDLFESWDRQLSSSYRQLAKMPSNELKEFNFNEIDPNYQSIIVTPSNVATFIKTKLKNEIRSTYQVQLIMITLGFVRACPANILALSNADLAKIFKGNKSINADELFSIFSIEGPISELTLLYFVDWLRSLNSQQLMGVFQFITGMRVIPPGGLSKLNLKIQFLNSGTEHLIPQANTCRKSLILPPYKKEHEAMERFGKLLALIESGDAFGFGFV